MAYAITVLRDRPDGRTTRVLRCSDHLRVERQTDSRQEGVDRCFNCQYFEAPICKRNHHLKSISGTYSYIPEEAPESEEG